MDVSPNPGPTLAHVLACKRACSYATHVSAQGMQFMQLNTSNQRLLTVADNEPRFVYQRKDLLAFNVAQCHRLESEVLLNIKAMGVSRCRVNKTETETSREMHNNPRRNEPCRFRYVYLRACLREGGRPQIGEVTPLGGVKNNPPLRAILQPRQPGEQFLKITEWSLSTLTRKILANHVFW